MDPIQRRELQEQVAQKYLGEMYGRLAEDIQKVCFEVCVKDPKEDFTENQKCCMDRCSDRYRDAHREVSEAIARRLDAKYAGKNS
mmetsp:Transcript_26613/g.74383  ORF Transcript_26613/g.74383 Transcript_26613/m.74383 type:complete len:85 (+) Transcript_26613:136-390(+)|eukprot:CAMPEP_0119124354 /NCGR_PEP_ID=MMETSP1310-20130426/4007_1 /TAXON_ID=464262 /ORGANISM="Genus nov. species nov., Strain RCC2339" /LENGTH=84 /DNA_ID=CAMNT_0007114297 /DNA_START=134 /DNA_END=388 /DNA_ORIENTATION=-